MAKPWFGVKAYGIGLGPKSVEGWAAMAVYALLMIATPPVVSTAQGPPVLLTAYTVALLGLVVLKSDGRPWRWRWGRDD